MIKLIDEYKFKICEDIFGEGNYNFELFQYALEKIFEEDRKIREEEERLEEEKNPKISWLQSVKNSKFAKYLSGGLVLFSIGTIGFQYYLYSGNAAFNSFFK